MIAVAWYVLNMYVVLGLFRVVFFFSGRRRHTRYWRDWSSVVCSSDLFLRVDHRNAFLTSFLSQSGRALDLLHNRGALRYKIFAFFLAELRVIHHRIIQQPAKESCAQAPVPPLFGLGKRFVCHGADPLSGW